MANQKRSKRRVAGDPGRGFNAGRLREPLSSLRLRPPARVAEGSTAAEAIGRMRTAATGACLVEDRGGRLVGIFTERDLLNKVALDGVRLDETPVEAWMHPTPETLRSDHPIAFALNRMSGGNYRNVPLVDDEGRAVGLVTLRDIVNDICETFAEEIQTLPPTRRAAIASEREGA